MKLTKACIESRKVVMDGKAAFYTCVCGMCVTKENNHVFVRKVTVKQLIKDYDFIRTDCLICTAKLSLRTLKEQEKDGHEFFVTTGFYTTFICSFCAHGLGLDKKGNYI